MHETHEFSGYLSGFLMNRRSVAAIHNPAPIVSIVCLLPYFSNPLACMPVLSACQVNMSIAILPMAEQYSWTPATVGLVQSSFFWGYLLTQVRQVESAHGMSIMQARVVVSAYTSWIGCT